MFDDDYDYDDRNSLEKDLDAFYDAFGCNPDEIEDEENDEENDKYYSNLLKFM